MIKGLPAYADYRPSGIPWLGYDIPTHWTRRKLRSLFARQGSGTTPSGNHHYNGPVCWVMSGDLNDGILSATKRTVKTSTPLNVPSLRVYPTKSLVVAMYGATIGRASILSVPACTNQACAAFADQYVHHVVVTARSYLVQQAYGGGQPNINAHVLCSLPVPLPPPDEQAAIVRFLDWATRRVDRAIRAKRRLVALLTEQKQAIIHRAVTQGLDPSVPMKASGIPWLGEIPAHWEVRRLSAVARFRNGKAHEQFIDPAGAYVCVNARFVSTDGHKRKLCTRNLTPAHIGDVLMVMSDLPNGRALARAFLVRDDGHYAVNQRVCALTPHKIDPRLLAYSSNRNWHLLRQNDGFNQTHLSNYDFKTMPILLPPPDEQIQIAEWIDHRVRAMDAQLGGLASQIELLREYRARLVADVVTGKLDVRAFAETLPDEAPDDIEATEADVDEDADDDETGDGADEG